MLFPNRNLSCPHCTQAFGSLGALRVHIAAKHKDKPTIVADSPTSDTAQQDEVPTLTLSAASKRRALQQHVEDASMKVPVPLQLQSSDPQTRFAWLHSSTGLCICRHCGRECYSWDDLKVHIFTLACPRLFPDSTVTSLTITAPENRLALIWQDKIRALRPPLWESIAISIREEATDYKHRCPICDQWLIQARGLGHHFMAYHPQAFNALVTARQRARASRKSLALCSPCRYCRSPCSGHPTKTCSRVSCHHSCAMHCSFACYWCA